jgi:beta-lactamase regulating signal transducer with metallopeptidase domain
MAEIIRTILIMSLSGTVLALLLFALKPLAKNGIPKASQYYLWVVVIAALLMPVSLFYNAPQGQETPTMDSVLSMVESQFSVTSPDGQEGFVSSRVQVYGEDIIIQTERGAWFTSVSAGAIALFMLLYPAGFAAVLIYHLLAYALFLRKTRRHSVRADIDCKIPVYFNPKATTPMLVGLFRPKIILPEREYSDAQLQAVLLHELTHLRRKDVLIKWLSVLACALHWFNPIVWLVRREMDKACELSCDEAVIAKLDASGRQTYGDTLIYVAAEHKPRTALAMSESGRNLKERLGAIMKNKKWSRSAIIIGTTALLIAGVAAAVALGAGSGENGKDGKTEQTNDNTYSVTQILDYYRSDSMTWDGSHAFTIPEFPDVTFTWTAEKLSATENGVERGLFTGMPVWSVYLCDLTGDGTPEICSTVSFGSGIIDDRIIAYDCKANAVYELADRMAFDYTLSMQDQKLICTQRPYDESSGENVTQGSLAIKDGRLIMTA